MRIKNVIFDVGDVLIEYRWKQMLMDYGLSEEEAIRVGGELFENPEQLWSEFDKGLYTQEEIICAYEKRYPRDAKAIRYFISHGEYMHVPRPKIWELLHQLKEAGAKVYLLSNYPEELFHKHLQYADFMNDIDGKMVSYMIKKAKPDEAIYYALCDNYGLKMEECIFFDDREENIATAKRLGMSGKKVTSKEMLQEELIKLIDEFKRR